jgi:hypothetical protein
VFPGTRKIVYDDPATIGQPLHGALVDYAQTAIAIVLAFKSVGLNTLIRNAYVARSLRPIDPEKAAGAAHLVFAIDSNSIMNGGTGKSVIPRRRTVIQIGTRVACEVNAFPPKVNVQLIGLERTTRVTASADHGPGSFVAYAEVSSFNAFSFSAFSFNGGNNDWW